MRLLRDILSFLRNPDTTTMNNAAINPTSAFAEKLITPLLLVVLLVGFYIRVDDYRYWQQNQSEFFFKSKSLPVAIEPDGYYYIDIADEYLIGKVRKIDDRRHFPQEFRKPLSVPLLSFVIASFSKLTGWPVEWIAVFLPAFCGVVAAIPAYFMVYNLLWGGRFSWRRQEPVSHSEAKITGLLASLLTLLSPAFVERSSVGFCDTDMLHLSFSTTSVLLAIMLMRADTPRRVICLQAAWVLNLLLFLWWWDTAFWPASLLAGGPWFIALMMNALNNRQKKSMIFLLLLSGLVVFVFSSIFDSNGGFISNVKGLYNYVYEVREANPFPIPAQHVAEQDDVNLQELALGSSGGTVPFVFGLVGLVLLVSLVRKKMLVLLPLLLVGALAVSGARFMLFTAPLFGLGGAVLVLTGWKLCKPWKMRITVAAVLSFLLVGGPLWEDQKYEISYPRTKAALFEGMEEFAGDIPNNGVIWASWGHGHPLTHYTKKNTIGDGISPPASLLYIQNFPLATNSFQLSANWICFYVKHGQKGLARANLLFAGKDDWAAGMPRLQELLRAGPEQGGEILRREYKLSPQKTGEILAFLFPVDTPPVYLLLDYMFLREKWYTLGKWDLLQGSGPSNFTKLRIDPFIVSAQGSLLGKTNLGNVHLDLAEGIGRIGSSEVKLIRMVYEYGQEKKAFRYPGLRKGYVLYVLKNVNGEFCVLTDYPSESVFLKLFFEKLFDQTYFRPVIDKSPLYLLCEVRGDRFSPVSFGIPPGSL